MCLAAAALRALAEESSEPIAVFAAAAIETSLAAGFVANLEAIFGLNLPPRCGLCSFHPLNCSILIGRFCLCRRRKTTATWKNCPSRRRALAFRPRRLFRLIAADPCSWLGSCLERCRPCDLILGFL